VGASGGTWTAADANGAALSRPAGAEELEAKDGEAGLASCAGERGGGAAQPVRPGDAGGAPPTINTVASTANG
jgi:hypothetical protein